MGWGALSAMPVGGAKAPVDQLRVSVRGGASRTSRWQARSPGGRRCPSRTRDLRPVLRPRFTGNHERNQPHNSTRDCLRAPGRGARRYTGTAIGQRNWYPPGAQCLLNSRSGGPPAHIVVEKWPPMLSAQGRRSRRGIPAGRGGGTGAERPEPALTGRTVNLAKIVISHDSLARQHLPLRHTVAGAGRTAPRDLPLQCCATSTSMLECRRTLDLIS
jgi:hypothetical protein